MTVGSVAPKRNCTCPFAPSVGWSFAASQRFASSNASASFGVRLSISVSFGRRSKTTGGTSEVTVTNEVPAPQNERRHLVCHRYLRRRGPVRRHGIQASEYREAGSRNCLYAVSHGLAISSDQLISFTKKPTGLRMMSSSLVGGLSAVVATAL